MRTLYLVLLSLLLSSCLTHSFTNNVFRDSNNQVIRWQRSAFPLTVRMCNPLSVEEQESIQSAARDWNAAVGRGVLWVSPETLWCFEDPPTNTVYVQSLDIIDYDYLHIQGLTKDYADTGSIDASIVFLDFSVPSDEVEIVMVHEFGHVLGLAHDTDDYSIMFHFAVGSGRHIMEDDVGFIRWEMTQ